MRTYKQLTHGQRYQIYALLKAGHNQTDIAAFIQVHKSTVSRELRRNRGQKGYRKGNISLYHPIARPTMDNRDICNP